MYGVYAQSQYSSGQIVIKILTIPLNPFMHVVQQTGPLARTPFMELKMHLTLEFTNLMGMAVYLITRLST